MRTTTFLIALLAASATLQQQLQIKGCLNWQKFGCVACYERQQTTKGCGPLLPVTDTCLIHGEQPGQQTQCIQCKPGYGVNQKGQCVQGNIFNCVFGLTDPSGKALCQACGNGQYPTADRTQCAPLPTGALPNCQWGARRGGQIQCLKCYPGYATLVGKGTCVALNAATAGCWMQVDATTCQVCDVIAGYSMQKNGKCKFIKKE